MEVVEAYIEMPILDASRAKSIGEFLGTEFASQLQKYNSDSESPDLDIDAFRKDIIVLHKLLSRAATRPAWPVYELIRREPQLKRCLMVTPLLDNKAKTVTKEERFCTFVLKPDDDLYLHMQGEVSIGLDADSTRQLYDFYEQTTAKRNKISELTDADEIITGLLDNIRNTMVTPLYSRRAIDISEQNHLQQSFDKLLNRGRHGRWLSAAVSGSDEKALLSIRNGDGALGKWDYDALCRVSERAETYLRRIELATNLRDAFLGQNKNKESMKTSLQKAKEQLNWFFKSESNIEKEWHSFMQILAGELTAVEDPTAIPHKYGLPFGNVIAPVLTSPTYEPRHANYAECLLGCHPFSQPEGPDTVKLDKLTQEFSRQSLEKNLSSDVQESLDWLENLEL
jgi:hypothetical protein